MERKETGAGWQDRREQRQRYRGRIAGWGLSRFGGTYSSRHSSSTVASDTKNDFVHRLGAWERGF